MTDISAAIETMEHRLMRAWIDGDVRAMKSVVSRQFRMVIGSKPVVMLDSKSWLEAASERFTCHRYRFGDLFIHQLGTAAIFATPVEATMRLDGVEWSGTFWITDHWRRGRVRRGWRIVDRTIARMDDHAEVPAAIKAMQLWGRRADRMAAR